MKRVTKEVREVVPVETRRAAAGAILDSGADQFFFEVGPCSAHPDNWSCYVSACCRYEARAKAWERYLREHFPEQEAADRA
jgi:hypothetical protein